MSFPKDFLIGAATAAHQVEGNNVNSDYWAQEHMEFTSFNEPSNDACDHYSRYEEDIRLLAEAGLNAYRFSIEWARIEPEEGKFDETEIEHYRKVIGCCKAHGVEPIVTSTTSPLPCGSSAKAAGRPRAPSRISAAMHPTSPKSSAVSFTKRRTTP